jgi:hypothetical protein
MYSFNIGDKERVKSRIVNNGLWVSDVKKDYSKIICKFKNIL